MPAEIRDVSFPTAVHGYGRRAVDAYVERVNRLIAELEVSSSPQAAVRHALDRVGEQTSGILQRARETAEEITVSSRAEAEETTARGRAEASEIIAQAKARAEQIVAQAERNDAERQERGERELGALRTEAEASLAEAKETTVRARAEASEIIAQAKAQAEQIVARADREGAQRLTVREQELTELEGKARERMDALRADTDAIDEERRKLLDDIHRLAARLEELVGDEARARLAEPEPEPEAARRAEPGDAEAAERLDVLPAVAEGGDQEGPR